MKILSKDLKNEKINLEKKNKNKKRKITDIFILNEINNLIEKKTKLKININSVYNKLLSFNKKNDYSIFYSLIDKEIIQQVTKDIKIKTENNNSNNDLEINILELQKNNQSIKSIKIKIELYKESIYFLNQKFYNLVNNFNLQIKINDKLNDYKKEKFFELDNNIIESEILKEETENNTNEPSTSFDSLNNQTIIKQKLTKNLTDDEILIESEIEFNDHIKSEILKEETENNTESNTSFNLSNDETSKELPDELQEFILDNLSEESEPLYKKIKLNEAEKLDYYDYDPYLNYLELENIEENSINLNF